MKERLLPWMLQKKRIIRVYSEQLYAKLDHLNKMDKFLKRCKLPKQNQIEVENLKEFTTKG